MQLMRLFQPDNFSESHFVAVLNHYFREYTLRGVFQLDRPEVNSENYKAILDVKGRLRTVLIRKYKSLSNLEQVHFYLTLIENLAKNGVPVSRIIKNERGESAMEAGGDIVALFEFIDGQYFPGTEESLASAAEAIAKMHASFGVLSQNTLSQIAQFSSKTKAYYNIIEAYSVSDFVTIREIIEKKANKNDSDRVVLEKMPLFITTVTEIKNFESSWLLLPRKLIHSDLHPHNVLFKNGLVAAILDFDAVRISQQARDVAFALYRFGRQCLIGTDEEQAKFLGPRLRELFIEKYMQIKKISSEELRLMPLLVKDEFIKKLLLVLKGTYLEDNRIWAKDLPKFLVAIEEIDYFWPIQ